ncbi:MAG: tail fiber domain-containing protein [Cyclobacteriaceae bacterium]|nr:tail fiber domain-containing protein [Cyclobacteriaceae bacterium]
MLKKTYLFLITLLFTITLFAQQSVSIGDTQTKTNAVLYLKGSGNQGLIIPIVSSNGSFGEQGMVVYNSSDKKLYYHNGTTWVEAGGGTFSEVDGVIGNEVTQVNSTRGGLELTGAGTSASPLSIGIIPGTVNGQILKWNDTTKRWELGSDNAGGAPSVDNTSIGLNGSSQLEVRNLGIATAKVQDGAITTIKIADGNVTDAKVASGIAGSKVIPNFGAQNIVTSGTLSVGGTTTFNTRAYTWPNTVAAANTYLRNDGTGNLSWQTVTGSLDQTSQTGILIGNGTSITGLASSAASQYLRRNAGNTAYEFSTLTAADVPALDAAKITTGTFPLTRITGGGAGVRAILGSDNNTLGWVSGSANQLLGTDASGVLQFINKSDVSFNTANAIPRGNGTSLVSSSFFDNGTYTAIGRSTPVGSSRFDIETNAASGNYGGMYVTTQAGGWPFYGYYNSSGSSWSYMDGSDGNKWKLSYGFTVTPNGEVGVLSSSPTATLHVTRGTSNGGTAQFQGTTRSSHFNFSTNEDTYIRGGKAGSNVYINDDGGNVGIGTTSPNAKLHVSGSGEVVRFETPSNPLITFYEGATYRGFIQGFSGAMYLGTVGGGGDIVLYANGGQGLIVNTSRLVGLSRTPVTNRLEVNGEASKNTAGSWVANSDRRIKTDIQSIENGIETIKKLHPVKFRYTDYWLTKNPEIKDKYYYNFIAQEFQQVFPEAVKGSGEFIEGDPVEILQVDTYNAEIVTIKAVQELIDRVEKLERENLQLKNEKASLEQELRTEIAAIKNLLNIEAKSDTKKK